MALLPPRDLIYDKIESVKIWQNKPRSYLGYSGMGNQCQRLLKLQLHWCIKSHHEARIERLFRRGDYEETVIAKDFEHAGIDLFDDQLEVVGGHGYAKGHIDGKVFGVPGYETEIMLFEAKTMNEKRFKEYLKKSLREVSPIYYGQIQSYMGKLGLKNTLYVVTNKNDEARSYKILPFDEDEYLRLEDIANTVPLMEELPTRLGGKTWFACKFCDARQLCHYKQKVRKTCRSCANVTMEGDGKWGCSLRGDHSCISYDTQLKGCENYKLDAMFED